MRRSKRKVKSVYGSATRYSEPPAKKCPLDTVFDSPGSKSNNEYILHNLLEVCLLRIILHVWTKIIPSSPYDVENMAFLMGQK